MPKAVTSLVGRTFGWLRVIDRGQPHPSGKIFWRCRCKCGSERDYRSDGLKCRDYVSCGCKKVKQLFKHGMSQTPEHRSWSAMIERCHTKTHQNFPSYGGRGIKVCVRWRRSFKAFLADMGHRPAGFTLDRIDNNKGYSASNCRWATPKQQQRNMRSNKIIVIRGVSMCVAEAAEKYGKPYHVVWQRIAKGWHPERAVR